MRIVVVTGLFGLLAAALAIGWLQPPPIPAQRAALPVELRAINHLQPAEIPLAVPSAEWDAVQPPAAPVVSVTATPSRPKLPQYRDQQNLPRYTPKGGGRLNLDELHAGTFTQLEWGAGESLHGASVPTPVLVAKGQQSEPVLCVTAAVHGDELNGIEAVRKLMYTINVEKLHGTLIGVPIVNLQGFQRSSRYLADRRDLNRFFPGNPRGSVAARMAYSFFQNVVLHCDGLVDLHTGSFHRTNLPQLRANLHNPAVLELTKGFGSTTILHSLGGDGTLRKAAVDAGIPAVTLEAGEPQRLQEDAIDHSVKALFTLLDTLKMYNKRSLWGNPQPTYYQSAWVRADQGGMLFSKVKLGRSVSQGDVLGSITDPITSERAFVIAPYAGRVIGMAVNQFVMPGYATYHLAAQTELEDVSGEPLGESDLAGLAEIPAEDSE